MEDYLRFSIAPLANLTTSEVEQLVKECVETRIVDKLFPQANTLINHLANEGIDMLIISASVSFLVAEVGRCIGIRQTLGINMREVHGHYSAEIEGVPSYHQGKVTRLQQWQELSQSTTARFTSILIPSTIYPCASMPISPIW